MQTRQAMAATLLAVSFMSSLCILGHGNNASSTCVNQFVTTVITNARSSDFVSITTSALEDQFLPCLDDATENLTTKIFCPIPTLDLPVHTRIAPLVATYNKLATNKVQIDVVPTFWALANDLEKELNSTDEDAKHAGMLFFGVQMVDVAHKGMTKDLSYYLNSNPGLWSDVMPGLRKVMTCFSGQVTGLPVQSQVSYMIYRRDVLAASGLPPPDTWQELLDAASVLNGTDMDGDGQPDWAICGSLMGVNPGQSTCNGAMTVLGNIVDTFTQVEGLAGGSMVDPTDLTIYLTSAAGYAAADILQQLLNYLHPWSRQECSNFDTAFVSGQCAISVNGRTHAFKATQRDDRYAPLLRGKVGVKPMPGSTQYLNRMTGQLENCTRTTCKFADTKAAPDGSTQYINRITRLDNGIVCGITSYVDVLAARHMFPFISYVTSSEATMSMILLPNNSYGPTRQSQLVSKKWLDAGYHPTDVAEFLDATKAVMSNANVGTEWRVAGYFRDLTIPSSRLVAQFLQGNLTATQMLTSIEQLWDGWINTTGRNYVLQQYRDAIGWIAPAVIPAPSPGNSTEHQTVEVPHVNTTDSPDTEEDQKRLALGLVVTLSTTIGGLIIIGVCGAVYVWKFRNHLTFTRLRPPRGGSQTTIIVTDIQDSTSLWETLPMSVMDEVLRLHHKCLREALPRFQGYESTTEGDSFILAFHTPQDALQYALDIQIKLLAVDWPDILMEYPSCKAVHVMLNGREPIEGLPCPTAIKRFPTFHANQDGMSQKSGSRWEEERPTAAHPAAAGQPSHHSWLDSCRSLWSHYHDALCSDETIPVFRGVRVRMGLHSGIDHEDVVINQDDSRMHYTGPALLMTKVLADCGQGGVITIGKTTHSQLNPEQLAKAQCIGIDCGLHILVDHAAADPVYQVFHKALMGRLCVLDNVRSLQCVQLGAYDAPVGHVAVCCIKVQGIDVLKKWDVETLRAALDTYHKVANEALLLQHGYLIKAKNGTLVAALPSAQAAITFALRAIEGCLDADWPDKLLLMPLGEEISILSTTNGPSKSLTSKVLMRGLRLRVGVHDGPVATTLDPLAGVVVYRGAVIAAAEGMAAGVTSGQVVLSNQTWERAVESWNDSMLMVALPHGQMRVKGIPDALDLVQIRCDDDVGLATRH